MSSPSDKSKAGPFSFPATFTEKKLVIPSTGELVDRKPAAETLRSLAKQLRGGRSASEVFRPRLTK